MKCYVVGFVLLLASASVCDAQTRKWTDVTGKYSIEAEFVELKDGQVRLRKPGGQVIALPLEKLSAADQQHVRQEARQPAVGREKPREPARMAKPAAWKPVWTTNPARMRIPEGTVSGKIHGEDFVLDAAELQNGILTLRQGKDTFPDLALTIFLFLKEGETVERKKFKITPKSGFGCPHIHVKWREKKGEGMPETEMLMDGYAMVLEFGKKETGKIPGRIYACLSDKLRSVVGGSFTIIMADETTEPGAGEIRGKITVPAGSKDLEIEVGCLGTNPEGALESPSAGFKLDGSATFASCMTWKPRNSILSLDKKTNRLTHKHVNRPPGRYLVYVRGNRRVMPDGRVFHEGYYDWKWVEIKDDNLEVTVDLTVDPGNSGTIEVTLRGSTKERAVTYLPLDDDGQLPLPGGHYSSSGTTNAKLEDGKAVIRGLREGKYQVAMGPWQRGARSPDGKRVLEMLPSVTADVEVKRGSTSRVELTPPVAAPSRQAPARKTSAKKAPRTTTQPKVSSEPPDLQVARFELKEPWVRPIVRNAGGTVATGFDVVIFVDGKSKASRFRATVPPGEERFLIATGLQRGTHVYKVVVDPDDKVRESDETNNSKEAKLSSPR